MERSFIQFSKNGVPVLLSLCLLAGCSTGVMQVHEVEYYRVSNGTNANYFRLTVDAESRLGVAEYRSGWFPSRSVDSLFGDVSTDGSAHTLQMRNDLEGLINTNVFKTTAAWLAEASKPEPDTNTLKHLSEARKRVLSYPLPGPLPNSVEMDFNPIGGLVTPHGDEKLIFLMASNPDEVVGKIANFTESDKTSLSIQKLSGVVRQKEEDNFLADLGRSRADYRRDELLYGAITNALQTVSAATATSPDALVQINALINLIDGIKP